MNATTPRDIAETIHRALNATRGYQPPGRDLTPGGIAEWGPAPTADLTVAEPDGSTWTVRVFKGLDDKDAQPPAGFDAWSDVPPVCAGCGSALRPGEGEEAATWRTAGDRADGGGRYFCTVSADALHHPRTTER